MSYEIVISRVKKIESDLVKIGAEGRGLHEKLSSIESKLEEKLIKKIRFAASVRNKLIHDDDVELTADLLINFQSVCDEIDKDLASSLSLASTSKSNNKDIGLVEEFINASPLKKVGIVGVGVAIFSYLISR